MVMCVVFWDVPLVNGELLWSRSENHHAQLEHCRQAMLQSPLKTPSKHYYSTNFLANAWASSHELLSSICVYGCVCMYACVNVSVCPWGCAYHVLVDVNCRVHGIRSLEVWAVPSDHVSDRHLTLRRRWQRRPTLQRRLCVCMHVEHATPCLTAS